ncbi:hypothetical protein NDU88_008109 [Pleurodeles waltl]|uniref:Uncharacterized protein n=1 Tax=Pleurodeles waltl TaxID=8319 RepID=A0AAV7NVJ3_PLEWA|nr:hypothetical protein NDU88_008109 [Pleurodeles waltl]
MDLKGLVGYERWSFGHIAYLVGAFWLSGGNELQGNGDGARLRPGGTCAFGEGWVHGFGAAGGEEGRTRCRGGCYGLLTAAGGSEAFTGEERGRGGGRSSPGKRGRVVAKPAGLGRQVGMPVKKAKGGAAPTKESGFGIYGKVRVPRFRREAAKRVGEREQRQVAGEVEEQRGQDLDLDPRQMGMTSKIEGEAGAAVGLVEDDPLIPVSAKWPTILEWSDSGSDGAEEGKKGMSSEEFPLLTYTTWCPAKSLRGACAEGVKGGMPGFRTAGDFEAAGTPDLFCQGERGGQVEPGERGAARAPWHEGQAEPRAAGRSASPGGTTLRRLAADTFGERCGGRGFAPAGAPASRERRSGPLEVTVRAPKRHAVRMTAGASLRWAQEEQDSGSALGCEDDMLDYEEASIEEGELVDDGEENNWWEQGRMGPANALSKSLQDQQDHSRARVQQQEDGQRRRRKAQERPPSLPAGEDASVTMVSVAVEAIEAKGLGAARLSKGVYVADAGVGTEGTAAQGATKGNSVQESSGPAVGRSRECDRSQWSRARPASSPARLRMNL